MHILNALFRSELSFSAIAAFFAFFFPVIKKNTKQINFFPQKMSKVDNRLQLDVDSIQSGQEYSALKDSYVIFLCLGDAFGHRLPVYTFRYRAEEDKNILMNDGTVNIFFNATMYDKMQSENMFLKIA